MASRKFSTAIKGPIAGIPPVANPYVDPSRNRMLLSNAKSYDEVRQAFHFPKPEYFNIGTDITDKHAVERWDKPAIIFVDEAGRESKITFGEMTLKSNEVANALVHRLGVKRGDRVAIVMSQSPEAAILHAAIYKVGAIAVPLFVLFGPEALKYRIQDSSASTVFVEPSKLDEIVDLQKEMPNLRNIVNTSPMSVFNTNAKGYNGDAVTSSAEGVAKVYDMSRLLVGSSNLFTPVLTKPDDPALLIYTSGTTGPPKGALHAHRTLLGHLPGVEFPQNLFPQEVRTSTSDGIKTPDGGCWFVNWLHPSSFSSIFLLFDCMLLLLHLLY